MIQIGGQLNRDDMYNVDYTVLKCIVHVGVTNHFDTKTKHVNKIPL